MVNIKKKITSNASSIGSYIRKPNTPEELVRSERDMGLNAAWKILQINSLSTA